MEDKILEMLMEKTEAGKTTYKDVNEMLNKLRQKMMQKLLDKEFEEHMKYKKGSHEEKINDNRRNGKGSTKTLKTTDG